MIYIFVLFFGKIFPLINSIFQEFIRYYGIAITAFILIAVFVDLGFYFEFKARLNYLVFDYIEDFDTILKTIISVYPYNILLIII